MCVDGRRYPACLVGVPPRRGRKEVDDAAAPAQVAAYRDVGVTWWLAAIAPYRFEPGIDEPWDFERLRECVLQGPPAA